MVSTILVSLIANPISIAVKVEGDGYLRFAKGPMIVYARQAKLVIGEQGLTASDGSILVPRVSVPVGAKGLLVSLDGTIAAKMATGPKPVGRLVLALFDGSAKFQAFGSFVRTGSKPSLANPGEGIAGVTRTFSAQQTAPSTFKTSEATTTAPHKFAPGKAEVRVNTKSEIEDEYIKLGSIAEIDASPQLIQKLKNLELGRAPIFGSSRGLTSTQVRATILAAGIDVRSMEIVVPAGASVERKCQKITADTITLAVQEAVKKKLGFETNLELKNRLQTLCVPMGELMIDVAQVQMNNGQISASVDVNVGKKLVSSLSLTYSMPNLAQVKRGESVRLRLVSNAAKVEVSAKAKSEAYLGQKITVETATGAVQTGTLIGPNLVEVRL
jgi:hypothetical protein